MSLGIFAAISSAVCCGFIPVITKWMQNTGMTSVEVLFYRFGFVFIMAGLWLLFKREDFRINLRQLLALAGMTVFGYGGSTLLLATSFNDLPIGLATMLYFSYPLFVLIIMTLIFKEKLTRFKAVSFGLAVFGIFCLMHFNFDLFNIGSVFALGSGLAYAIYLVGIQKSSVKTMNSLMIVFYLAGFSCIFFAAQGLAAGTPDFLAIDGGQLFLGALIGGITVYVLGAIAYAIRRVGSTKTSLIISFEAVVSLVLGILIFDDPWTPLTWVGAALMTLAVVMITREDAQETLSDQEWEAEHE